MAAPSVNPVRGLWRGGAAVWRLDKPAGGCHQSASGSPAGCGRACLRGPGVSSRRAKNGAAPATGARMVKSAGEIRRPVRPAGSAGGSESSFLGNRPLATPADPPSAEKPTRRDFLFVATGTFAAVGGAFALWPLVDQMNPDAGAMALATTEVDVGAVEEGQSVVVKWRGRPVVVRRRTAAELAAADETPLADLIDPLARNANLPPDAPATDANRAAPAGGNWLVMVQVCTHLGCIPLGQHGDYGGWFCPCHGSVYDTAGRVRVGPAPENMAVPPYRFVKPTLLSIG